MDGYQFLAGQSAYSHPNMAYPGGYMNPQFSAGFNANTHMPTPPYDPSTPSFQPNGMDMQQYHEPRTVPTSDVQKMQKYVVDMNVSRISDNARLEKLARGTAQEVEILRQTLQRDLRILESRIKSWQDEDAETDDGLVNTHTKTAMNTLSALDKKLNGNDDELLSIDLSPSREMLEHFSLPRIAEEYLTRADIMAAVASELRRQANKINGVVEEQEAPSDKLLEAPPTPGSKVIGFACCGTAYGDVSELLMHVKETHSDSFQPRLASDTGSPSTPNHTPAPRPRSSRSRAVEIKAPESNMQAETREMLARLTEKIGRGHGAGQKAALAAPAESQSSARPEDPDQIQIPVYTRVLDQPQALSESQAPLQAQSSTRWFPFAVTEMTEHTAEIPANLVVFSRDFIREWFGGEEWSSGFYFVPKAGADKKGKAYWLLDPDHEPHLPTAPGKHGAKLSAFFNETYTKRGYTPDPHNYMDCPVFIKEKGSNKYRYYGQYSQTRYSDKLDYDHMMDENVVPAHVRRYWATQLSDKGRPQWVTDCLMNHFWPRPTYDGPIPTDSAVQTPATFATGEDSAGGIERRVSKALNSYADELKEWQKDAEIKMNLLTFEAIFESFAKPDSDTEPGMRLWWEYFEFQNFDTNLYENLTRLSKHPSTLKASGKAGSKRPATPPIRGTRSTDLKAGALDEKEERKLKDFMPPKTHPATPPVRGTHEAALKAGIIDTSAIQVVKPSPKTSDDVAAAVATLQKEATKKQAAVDSKARKAALEQKQRDAAGAPTQPSYPDFNNDAPKTASRASAVPNDGLSGLATWLLDDDKKAEVLKPDVKKENKAMPTWGGGGDLTVAKRLNEEMKKGASVPGKGNAPKKVKASPPHLRKK